MGHTILLADDSITIQKVIELTFSDEDFTLHTVGNGQKAIEEIRSVTPDIVLCDIIMPEKNGYEVCEFIKTANDLKHIPVLLLTGAFEPFDQDRAKKAGCDGFLAKPFEPQTLISKVKELLASASVPPAAAAPVVQEAPSAPPPLVAEPDPEPAPSTVEMSFAPQILGETPALEDPTPMEDEGATLIADSLAVEVGEKELSVEPGDQTVLLGGDDTPTIPSEDIWNEVQRAPEAPTPLEAPPAQEPPADEGATLYMPPTEEAPLTPPESVDVGTGFDDFVAPIPEPGVPTFEPAAPTPEPMAPTPEPMAPTPEPMTPTPEPMAPTPEPMAPMPEPVSATNDDDAWVLPTTDEPPEPQPAEPELTPLGDFGGFDDFSSAEPKVEEQAPVVLEPPSFAPEPDLPSPGPEAADVPETPEAPLSPEAPLGFEAPAELEAPFSAEAPLDIGASISDLPMMPEPEAVDVPPIAEEVSPTVEHPPPIEPATIEEPSPFIEPSPVMEAPREPTPTIEMLPEASPEVDLPLESMPQTPIEPDPVFEEMSPPIEEPMMEPSVLESPTPAPPAEPVLTYSEPPPSTAPPATPLESEAMPQNVDALVDQIAERVVAKLSEKVVQELAWEVVPDMAETLIQKEIDALKAKMPK